MINKMKNYSPFNEQEQKDKQIILEKLKEKDVLTRNNKTGHFCVSAWIINQDHNKVLMCFHKIYNSWSWLGGHVDGNSNFNEVILKEVHEESGLKQLKILDDLFSLEVLTVNGHIKKGEYVSSHLHYNITFLIEANDYETLIIKEDENKGLQWFDIDDVINHSNEPWMVENIYKKLNLKLKESSYV